VSANKEARTVSNSMSVRARRCEVVIVEVNCSTCQTTGIWTITRPLNRSLSAMTCSEEEGGTVEGSNAGSVIEHIQSEYKYNTMNCQSSPVRLGCQSGGSRSCRLQLQRSIWISNRRSASIRCKSVKIRTRTVMREVVCGSGLTDLWLRRPCRLQ
jgi:hypothetical protein